MATFLTFFKSLKEKFIKPGKTIFSYERKGIRPNRDWNIILICAGLMLSALIFIAFYFYFQIEEGQIFMVNEKDSQREIKINAELFQKIVNDINTRIENLEAINHPGKIPNDPSL